MKTSLRKLGTLLFWLAWPLFWLILNNTKRSRLMMFHENRLLVMKDWFSDEWILPGGGRHHSESPLEALIREVHEELGIELDKSLIKPLFSGPIHTKGINTELDYFLAQVSSQPPIKPQRLEVSDFAWLPPSDLNDENASVDLLYGLENYSQPD